MSLRIAEAAEFRDAGGGNTVSVWAELRNITSVAVNVILPDGLLYRATGAPSRNKINEVSELCPPPGTVYRIMPDERLTQLLTIGLAANCHCPKVTIDVSAYPVYLDGSGQCVAGTFLFDRLTIDMPVSGAPANTAEAPAPAETCECEPQS